jgi:hypothetical protein
MVVWDALMQVAMRRRHGMNMVGYAGTIRGIDIQVDLA